MYITISYRYIASYLISDVHWDILPFDAIKYDTKISIAGSFKELLNILSLKNSDKFSYSS